MVDTSRSESENEIGPVQEWLPIPVADDHDYPITPKSPEPPKVDETEPEPSKKSQENGDSSEELGEIDEDSQDYGLVARFLNTIIQEAVNGFKFLSSSVMNVFHFFWTLL